MRFDKLVDSMELEELRTFEYQEPPQAIIKDGDGNVNCFDIDDMDEIIQKCRGLSHPCPTLDKIREFLNQEQHRFENMYDESCIVPT